MNKTSVVVYFASRLPSTAPVVLVTSSSKRNNNATPTTTSTTQSVSRYSFTFASREQAERFCYDTILKQENLFRFFVSSAFHSAPISVSCSVMDKQKLQILLRKVIPKQQKRIVSAVRTLQYYWRQHKNLDSSAQSAAAAVTAVIPQTKRRRARKNHHTILPQRKRVAATKIQHFVRKCLGRKRAAQLATRELAQERRNAWLVENITPKQVSVLQQSIRLFLTRQHAKRVLQRFFARCLSSFRARKQHQHFTDLLSQQIHTYFNANLDHFETKLRPQYSQVLDSIRRILWNVSPYTTTCEAFGSTTTLGLALPSSDLDVVIHHCELSPAEFYEVLKQHTEFATHVQLVRAGGMFVIKLQTVYNIHVDVSFWNSKQHMGNSHSQFVQNLLSQYPGVLAPLVLVLKQFLRKHQLNSAFTGGLSSIAIVLMVWIYIRPTEQRMRSVGELLLGLLDFYGQPGFFANFGLCAKRGVYDLGVVNKAQQYNAGVIPAAAHIEDPLRDGNNLSFGMYRASQVSSSFAYMAAVLRQYERGEKQGNALLHELL